MDLSEKEKKDYNKIFQKQYNRNATEDEISEIKIAINGIAEIIYNMYIHDKKSGKLLEILKEIESKKLRKQDL